MPEEEVQKGDKKGSKKDKKSGKGSKSKADILPEISIEIEKIKAQIEAINQMRGMFNERFSTISEQIGELRTMIVGQEQEFSDLEIKSAKANEVMVQLEPEKFLSEISKIDMRIEAIKGKLESNESVSSMIMKELKEQRQKMALFKGIEDTMKLNQEVREELMGIKKIESTVDVHANKVESMFMQVQKRFNEFEKFKSLSEDLNSAFQEQKQEFDSMKVKFTEFVNEEDLNSQKEELSNIMDNFEKRVVNIEKISGNFEQLVTDKKFAEFKEKNLSVLKEHQKYIAGIQEIRERMENLTDDKRGVPNIENLKQLFADANAMEEIKGEMEKLRELMTYGFKRVQKMESKMFVEKETYETIRQLIKKYLDKGYTRSQITEAFEMQGWPRPLIKQYLEA